MDVMQMAGPVCLSRLADEIHGVYGPFGPGGKDGEAAKIFLKNGYGVSISRGGMCDFVDDPAGYAEMGVIRRVVPGGDGQQLEWVPGEMFGWVWDYSTPVTYDVIRGCSADDVVKALEKLLPLANDPTDMTVRRSPDDDDECPNGSPTCTPEDPCVVCYDEED